MRGREATTGNASAVRRLTKLSETTNNRSKSINNTENTKGARIDKLEECNGLKLWFLKTR